MACDLTLTVLTVQRWNRTNTTRALIEVTLFYDTGIFILIVKRQHL